MTLPAVPSLALVLGALAACAAPAAPPRPSPAASAPATPVSASQVNNPCAQVTPVALTAPPVMPPDFVVKSQLNADCMAWQEFLYLNWPVDPNQPGQPDPSASVAGFGKPGDTGATVWESYLTPQDVFGPSGKAVTWTMARPATRPLLRLSMLGDATIDLGSIHQAGSRGWLTDQRGNLIFYEIHLNQDEYDFITQNQLTTAAGQTQCASNAGSGGTGGFNLPAGQGNTGRNQDTSCAGTAATYGLNQGTIELKSAWRVLPADGSLNYRYKIAAATLRLPDGTTQPATVGLVGLHIIRKVPNAPQLVWATFEQIDNDPDDGTPPTAPTLPTGAPALGAYTLFNPSCDPAKDLVYHCATNTTLIKTGEMLPPCAQGSYTPGTCYPYWAPMQITRLVPVKTTPNNVTAYAWSQMPESSVFRYYRMIDVQWPSTPSLIAPGATVPLSAGGITPSTGSYIVSNTTMETFLQNQAACMDCHQYAGVAQPKQQHQLLGKGRAVREVFVTRATAPGQPSYASDYSFIFSTDTRH